jgi:hypothetical protein
MFMIYFFFRYGLFIPKKTAKGPTLKPAVANVFGDDSDEVASTVQVKLSLSKWL